MCRKGYMKTKHDDVRGVVKLGAGATDYGTKDVEPKLLETFPNRFPGSSYLVEFSTREFTSNCPKTGQPDFATITVQYIPDGSCLESKSLKLYFFSYRNAGMFMETICNNMLRHFVEKCKPKWMRVRAAFEARGGIPITVTAVYDADKKYAPDVVVAEVKQHLDGWKNV